MPSPVAAVEKFAVRGWNHNATTESVGILTAALEMERAMPVLETLVIKNSMFTDGMVYELARWLAGVLSRNFNICTWTWWKGVPATSGARRSNERLP